MQPETNDLQQRVTELRSRVEEICHRFEAEVTKLGFGDTGIPVMQFASIEFSLQTDPYTKKQAVHGMWKDAPAGKSGSIVFHVDGSFYAECDVVRPHPKDRRWFVESITAWGKPGVLKSEAKLLPALSS